MDLDEENLKDAWALGHFSEDMGLKAQGQAFYIMGLREDIQHMLRGVKDHDAS